MDRTACTEPQCLYSRARPHLPLWAVRSIQSFSACTVELYLYSPYGPYGLYRASVPLRGCTLPLRDGVTDHSDMNRKARSTALDKSPFETQQVRTVNVEQTGQVT